MIINFIVSAIRIGMTFLYGSTGETLTEKSGHLNLGIPGIMCTGAAMGCLAEALYTRVVGPEGVVPVFAVLFPILASFFTSALLGLIYSFLTVSLRANQNVTGLALTNFGIGIANYTIASVSVSEYQPASTYFTASLPFASHLGWFGTVFFSYGIMVYLSIAIALTVSFFLSRTRVGLNLRAVGENPATADAAGISVTKYRYLSTMIGSGIAGLGGLCYVMDNHNGNWEYVIDAIGWLAIALVIFTVWKPNIGILGSIIFGALYIISSYVVRVSFANKELLKMIPYAVTVIVLIITSVRRKRETQPPASLGLAYFREER